MMDFAALFDWAKVMEQYNAQDFAADGFAVFSDIMTEETTRQWSQALVELHELNDKLIMSDWRESIDWKNLRVFEPTAVHSDEEKDSGLGGGQQLQGMSDDNGGWAARLHGLLPEYFPPAHSSYLMFVLFHPQMLALHQLVLECDEVFYATAQSNCKVPGSQGSRWHSHGGMPRFNDHRIRTPEEYMAEGCMNLLLAYPAGLPDVSPAGNGDCGNINIIRGAVSKIDEFCTI